MRLVRETSVKRESFVEEIISYVRTARIHGLLAIESKIKHASNGFLREMLVLALEVKTRGELQGALETKIRLRERQGDADAKVLEVAGGFAPAIGVIGTVSGLIEVLLQFSNMNVVAVRIGPCLSTMYGLAGESAAASGGASYRASVAGTFEVEETCGRRIGFDRYTHPSLIRERLNCFLRKTRP
jgi:chemotaxis protein MotA